MRTHADLEELRGDLEQQLEAREGLEREREELLREVEISRSINAPIEVLSRLAAEDQGSQLARLADSLRSQERLYIKLLRAESPAHLAALRDELEGIVEQARKTLDGDADFLADLREVLQGLDSFEHLPKGEDQTLALGRALNRALAMQEQVGAETSVQPALGGMALESVRQIFTSALESSRQRADLSLELPSKEVLVRGRAAVILDIRNDGPGTAENITVELSACDIPLSLVRARRHLESLRHRQSARLEFLIEPCRSKRAQLVFHVRYDDPERQGKELDFVDFVELRYAREPATFYPLLPNPYVVGRPLLVSDPFFGRTELFARLTASLQGAHQDNIVVLIGQRRMGKTSILRRLGQHLPAIYVPVLVDLQALFSAGDKAFFVELVAQIIDELEDFGIEMSEPVGAAYGDDPGGFFRRRFLAGVRGALSGRRLLIVFDEMEVLEERIRAGELTPRVLPYLRSLMQHEGDVSFMLAGSHRLDQLTADYWGALFNLATYIDVGHLSEAAVGDLLREPTRGFFEIDSLALDKVYRTTGGHPHFSQLVARELVELCNRQKISYVTIQDVNRVIDGVVEKGQLHIAYLWDGAERDERLLLLATKELLEHDGMASLATVRRFLDSRDIATEDLSKALRRLRRKEILAEEAGQLHLRIDLLRRWLDCHHQELELFVRRESE